jgi:lipopolysaccharide/colanic/teichoic acid biosynthesis glycosyltransferase
MTHKELAAISGRETSSPGVRFTRQIKTRQLIPSDLTRHILPESLFLGMLCLERKRAERSNKKLLLLTVDAERLADSESYSGILRLIIRTVNRARRETDIAGWYKDGFILAILFTEFGPSGREVTASDLLERVRGQLSVQLPTDIFRKLHVEVHLFANPGDSSYSGNPAFYPDLLRLRDGKKTAFALKRAIDIVGAALALVLLSPLFLMIAVCVKLTSRGPVFFKQQRLGEFGKSFDFLKFRSMFAQNDPNIHRNFMKRLIGGQHNGHGAGSLKPIYKMTDDPRITKLGRFLRRTSLDELPQFINVLKGEMSLVGPRPPIPYEYDEYEIWHRRRVLEVKPGITGLWQVKGRSRVSFDDMVRLDLRYARCWSLWLDLWILLQTPHAVLIGEGAY